MRRELIFGVDISTGKTNPNKREGGRGGKREIGRVYEAGVLTPHPTTVLCIHRTERWSRGGLEIRTSGGGGGLHLPSLCPAIYFQKVTGCSGSLGCPGHQIIHTKKRIRYHTEVHPCGSVYRAPPYRPHCTAYTRLTRDTSEWSGLLSAERATLTLGTGAAQSSPPSGSPLLP